MKRKMITITLMALLVLLLSVGGVSGQGLWLGVDVGNTGINIVCEEIVPAPYALSLRPGGGDRRHEHRG